MGHEAGAAERPSFQNRMEPVSKSFSFASRNSETVLLGSDFHLQIAGHILSLKALKSTRLANVKSPLVSYAQLRSESVFLPASQPMLRPSVSQAALKGRSGTFLLRFLQPEEEAEGNVDLNSPSYRWCLGGLGTALCETATSRERAALWVNLRDHPGGYAGQLSPLWELCLGSWALAAVQGWNDCSAPSNPQGSRILQVQCSAL